MCTSAAQTPPVCCSHRSACVSVATATPTLRSLLIGRSQGQGSSRSWRRSLDAPVLREVTQGRLNKMFIRNAFIDYNGLKANV